MSEIGTTGAVVAVAVTSLLLLVVVVLGGRRSRLEERLAQLTGGAGAGGAHLVGTFTHRTLPKMGAVLLPGREEDRTKLQTRLGYAGFYGPQAVPIFLGVKVLLMFGPVAAGTALGLTGPIPLWAGLAVGCSLGGFGLIAPSFWLDARKAGRQATLRRAVPDALDVLVICLEGGASLPAALARVTAELREAHPPLAAELRIVVREMQLGRRAGDALREFGKRTDLEEVRSLATVIIQAERFGASLVKALRVHADVLRNKRVLYAEETAQKAVVKLLFPTVLFILPAVFIAVLGPNAILLWRIVRGMTF